MSKRNSLRPGSNPHAIDSVEWTVDRYGQIKPETMAEMVAWLKTQGDAYAKARPSIRL